MLLFPLHAPLTLLSTQGLAVIAGAVALRRLRLLALHRTDTSFAWLASLVQLEDVALSCAERGITRASLQPLLRLPRLRELGLHCFGQVEPGALTQLRVLHATLTTLELIDAPLGGPELRQLLAALPRLRVLLLCGWRPADGAPATTDVAAMALALPPGLKVLDLGFSELGTPQLRALGRALADRPHTEAPRRMLALSLYRCAHVDDEAVRGLWPAQHQLFFLNLQDTAATRRCVAEWPVGGMRFFCEGAARRSRAPQQLSPSQRALHARRVSEAREVAPEPLPEPPRAARTEEEVAVGVPETVAAVPAAAEAVVTGAPVAEAVQPSRPAQRQAHDRGCCPC